jgi:hypothetical protein
MNKKMKIGVVFRVGGELVRVKGMEAEFQRPWFYNCRDQIDNRYYRSLQLTHFEERFQIGSFHMEWS